MFAITLEYSRLGLSPEEKSGHEVRRGDVGLNLPQGRKRRFMLGFFDSDKCARFLHCRTTTYMFQTKSGSHHEFVCGSGAVTSTTQVRGGRAQSTVQLARPCFLAQVWDGTRFGRWPHLWEGHTGGSQRVESLGHLRSFTRILLPTPLYQIPDGMIRNRGP